MSSRIILWNIYVVEAISIGPHFVWNFSYFNSGSWGNHGAEIEKRTVVCKMVSSVFVDERKSEEIMGWTKEQQHCFILYIFKISH